MRPRLGSWELDLQARYVADTDLETLLDPESPPWRSQPPAVIPLLGTPLGLQPTAAIRVAWADKTTAPSSGWP
jgi:hypothetical protein